MRWGLRAKGREDNILQASSSGRVRRKALVEAAMLKPGTLSSFAALRMTAGYHFLFGLLQAGFIIFLVNKSGGDCPAAAPIFADY